MADTKISAMTVATAVINADLIPIVSAGANFSATKQLLLSGTPTEEIALQPGVGGNACFGIPGSLTNIILDDALGQMDMITDNALNITAGTTLTLIGTTGGVVCVANYTPAAGPFIGVPGTVQGNLDTIWAALVYSAAGPLNWNMSPPITYFAAIDRLAAAVAGLLGTAIP